MDNLIFFPLVQNAALLLALVFLYDAIPRHHKRQYFFLWRMIIGVIIGAIGMTIMSTPWVFQPGVIFDSRSVLLCITGVFFGGLPTFVAVVITALFRYSIGGPAVWAGIGVIVSSGLIGVIWRHYRKNILADITIRELYLLGMIVHVVMLLWMFMMPFAMALNVLEKISLPVLLIYPVATVLIGRLVSRRFELERDIQIRLQDDFLFRSQFNVGNIAIGITAVDRYWLKVNPRLCQMFQYSEAELLTMTWSEMTYSEDLAEDLQLFKRMLAGELDEYEMDKRFVAKDGSLVFTHMTVSCKRTTNRVQLVIAGYIDITEQKRVEQAMRSNQEQLALVLASSDLGFWDWDLKSDRVDRSERCAQLLGCEHAVLLRDNRVWTDAIHTEDRVNMLRAIDEHLRGDTPKYQAEYRIITTKGEIRWISDSGKVVSKDSDGMATRMCGIHTDITERKKVEASLQLAASVYNNSSEAMSVLDSKGIIINTNNAFYEITGYCEDEVKNQHIKLLHCARNAPSFYQEMNQQIQDTGYWQGEVWQRRKNGEEYIVLLTVNTIYSQDGEPYRRVALFSDITEKKQSEQLIWRQANYDTLTGLPNRRMMLEHLASEIKKSDRNVRHFALMFIDLDFFKEVNDTLGHDMGDLLLIQTAERLKKSIRDVDVVSRLGGDEFTVVLTDIKDHKGVERVAQNILTRIAEPYQLADETAYISASIGITLYPDDAIDVENLLKHADQAMYAAKEQGRNRFNYFTPSMQEYAKYRMRLIQDLRQAVAKKEFEVYYQPIVELATGNVHKAEALIRWHHNERGQVSPAEFIPIAEDTGMIVDIGNWVFEQAARQSVLWRERYGKVIQISVNKSPIQFRDEGTGFAEWIALLSELNISDSGICIEITEGLLLDASMGVAEKLLAYRDAGVQVSLDDFGTGYSSLAYLKRFDIDYLKIDQSFTRNLTTDENDMSLCEAIIVMAHKLGMKVIAEGVETEAQRQLLLQVGCDYGQGYLFSRPALPQVFAERYLEANGPKAVATSPDEALPAATTLRAESTLPTANTEPDAVSAETGAVIARTHSDDSSAATAAKAKRKAKVTFSSEAKKT